MRALSPWGCRGKLLQAQPEAWTLVLTQVERSGHRAAMGWCLFVAHSVENSTCSA